jgi:hypothetical protein
LAVVRELVTILGTEFDSKGLKEYEAGINHVKELALGLASALGLAFSVEKITEFVQGIFDSGQEIIKIRAQLTGLARPMDDVNAAMDRTFEIAQNVGAEYTKVADTYKEFLQASQDSKISQEGLLQVTENIYKAARVDRSSQEQIESLFHILGRVEVMGKASPRFIGMIGRASISSLRLLEDYFKTDEEGLRALAKSGKITFDELTKALSEKNDKLEASFAKVPWTIGRAFTYARNQMVMAAAEFLKITRLSIIFGTAIKWLTDQVVNMFKAFFNAIGGLKNAIEVLGIAMALVLGPRMLAYLIEMVAWMWRFTAANWAAVAPWLAMSAAVAAVAIAIQDLVYWIQGKPSLIGTWVGSFKDLKSNFAQLDIFSGFRAIGDVFKGDWKGAWQDLQTSLGSTQAIILEIVTAIGLVTAAFILWGVGGPVVKAILQLIETMGGVKVAATEAKAAAEILAKGKGSPGVEAGKPAGEGSLDGRPSKLNARLKGGFNAALLLANIANQFGLIKDERLSDAVTGAGVGSSLFGIPGAIAGGVGGALWNRPKFLPSWLDKGINDIPVEPLKPGDTPIGTFDWMRKKIAPVWADVKNKMSYLTPGMGAAGEYLNPSYGPPPAAMGPPGGGATTNNDNKQITLNQSNSVNVQVQDDSGLAARITKSISDYTGEMFSGIARDFGRSTPRTETATQ